MTAKAFLAQRSVTCDAKSQTKKSNLQVIDRIFVLCKFPPSTRPVRIVRIRPTNNIDAKFVILDVANLNALRTRPYLAIGIARSPVENAIDPRFFDVRTEIVKSPTASSRPMAEAASDEPANIPTENAKSENIIDHPTKSRVDAAFLVRQLPISCNPTSQIRKIPIPTIREYSAARVEFQFTMSKLCLVSEYDVLRKPTRKRATSDRIDFSVDAIAKLSE